MKTVASQVRHVFATVWIGMLEGAYHASKNSPAIIVKNLETALR